MPRSGACGKPQQYFLTLFLMNALYNWLSTPPDAQERLSETFWVEPSIRLSRADLVNAGYSDAAKLTDAQMERLCEIAALSISKHVESAVFDMIDQGAFSFLKPKENP